MKRRKGQAGGVEISILIMLIAFFILLYVILLPPEERASLLEQDGIDPQGNIAVSTSAKVLLSESPGMVHSFTTDSMDYNIEPLHLYSKQETQTMSLSKALTISRSILQDNYKDVFFDFEGLEDTKKANLIFLIKESKGVATIKLNDNIIYQGEMTNANLPIELPKTYLIDKNNKLHIEVDSPGWRIFSANYYLLQDVKIIKEVNIENLFSRRTIYLDNSDGQEIKKATLTHFINCNTVTQSGILNIHINDRLVHSDTIFCQYADKREIPIDTSYLNYNGQNVFKFSISKGDYNLDQVKLNVELAKKAYPKYTFEIDSETWEEINNGNKDVKISFLFGDGRNKANVRIQGKEFSFDTSSATYSREITSFLDNGANQAVIIPLTGFEIKNMKVYVE